jgi:cell division protein FtsW
VLLSLGSEAFDLVLQVTSEVRLFAGGDDHSIFAVVGEELGFIGGLILAFLYYLSLIFKIAAAERDKFASTMVAGIGAWIGLQVCLNLAAMVALTPLTGVPLPLVSYGGSALITMLGGIGLVLSVARHQK